MIDVTKAVAFTLPLLAVAYQQLLKGRYSQKNATL